MSNEGTTTYNDNIHQNIFQSYNYIKTTLYRDGVIPLTTHMKFIKELREKWVEELIFQKFHWEELQ